MEHLLPALALALVIEGVVLALVPHRLGEIVRLAENLGPERLRSLGLGVASLGAVLFWLLG